MCLPIQGWKGLTPANLASPLHPFQATIYLRLQVCTHVLFALCARVSFYALSMADTACT